MKAARHWLCLLACLASSAWAEPCSQVQGAEVLTPATQAQRSVSLRCDLTLKPSDIVTRSIRIEASDVKLDCKGALLDGGSTTVNAGRDMLEIRSRRNGDNWLRPENVEVSNCRIAGSVRVHGMAMNGEGRLLRDSSRLPGHVARARAAAPRRLVLRNLRISGTGRIPLYLAPGVSEVTLIESTLDGVSRSTAIYLDAESTLNVIENNRIAVDTQRELIAVDGSSHNRISSNHFYRLAHGGIFLYRNCGEGGTIRHSTPSHNRIVGNSFHYLGEAADKPAVYLGSRDGWRLYCPADSGFDFGSSMDDRDFANNNHIAGNQFIQLLGGTPIRAGGEVNQPNDIQQPNSLRLLP